MILVALRRLTSKQVERLVNVGRAVPIEVSEPLELAPVSARQRRLSEVDRTAVLQAYQSGVSMAALARTHGVRRETISKIIRDSGVQARSQRAISREQIGEAAALYRAGWSLARLGERYGFDGQTIQTHIKRYGVQMRGPHDWQH